MCRQSDNRFRNWIISVGSTVRILALLATLFSTGMGQELIHFGDVFDVDVVGSFDHDWRGGLTPEGFLDGNEKLTTPVHALCKTESEVAAAIKEQYGRILRNPTVVVKIIDRSNRALAYVNGAVRTPQRLQLRRALSLTELIVFAGGITDRSNGQITIFRPPNVNCLSSAGRTGQEPKRLVIKIADLLGGMSESNPTVLNGDIVTVTEAPPVFLTGGVATRKRLNLTPDLTLSRAIAAAGGVANRDGGVKVRVYRRKSETTVLEFDLKSIQQGKAEDPKLEPYDVVDVEERGKPARKPVLSGFGSERDNGASSKLPLRIVD